ncbi:unnamed protein product [Oikopleura dioica]|uniref:Uncharacterized protein n=1 Tax=Oikopleura dioica TaxID=34765 RepID=E4XW70_OIKDI|nr:unnamed protein product [Oikopleura dioica]
MEFLPLDLGTASTSKSTVLKSIKPLGLVTNTKLEITSAQYYEMVVQRRTSARYVALDRVVQEAVRKFERAMDETESVSNDMQELQNKRRERARLQLAIRGGTATQEDRQLYERSQDLDDVFDELLAKETRASAESEKSWERLEKAKLRLKEYAMETYFSHVYEEDSRYYKEGGTAISLDQPEKEDTKVVGAAWVQFWLKDAKLESISTESVKPMIKRYEDCVPASNPDYHAIKHLLDLLTTTPTMSRYDFLNKVRFTLRESCCVKFVAKINELVTKDDTKIQLSRSMDPKTNFLQGVKAQDSVHHGDPKLRKEALYIYGRCTEEQRQWLNSEALTEADRRKALSRHSAGPKNENKKGQKKNNRKRKRYSENNEGRGDKFDQPRDRDQGSERQNRDQQRDNSNNAGRGRGGHRGRGRGGHQGRENHGQNQQPRRD